MTIATYEDVIDFTGLVQRLRGSDTVSEKLVLTATIKISTASQNEGDFVIGHDINRVVGSPEGVFQYQVSRDYIAAVTPTAMTIADTAIILLICRFLTISPPHSRSLGRSRVAVCDKLLDLILHQFEYPLHALGETGTVHLQ